MNMNSSSHTMATAFAEGHVYHADYCFTTSLPQKWRVVRRTKSSVWIQRISPAGKLDGKIMRKQIKLENWNGRATEYAKVGTGRLGADRAEGAYAAELSEQQAVADMLQQDLADLAASIRRIGIQRKNERDTAPEEGYAAGCAARAQEDLGRLNALIIAK